MLQVLKAEDLQADHVDNACPSVNIEKIRYDASKRDIDREELLNLLAPVFASPDPQWCLALALQPYIAQAAMKCFGRPSNRPVLKVIQKWYDAECRHARAALKGTAAELLVRAMKSYNNYRAGSVVHGSAKDLCEMASRNPRTFLADIP